MPQPVRSDQQGYGSLIHFMQPQTLDLRVIPQHELLGVRIQAHLLVHPLRHRIADVVLPSCNTGTEARIVKPYR